MMKADKKITETPGLCSLESNVLAGVKVQLIQNNPRVILCPETLQIISWECVGSNEPNTTFSYWELNDLYKYELSASLKEMWTITHIQKSVGTAGNVVTKEEIFS